MDERWDVLGFGAVTVDEVFYVDRYPPPDTKVPVARRLRAGGGLAGTALVTVARLGGRAAYCGVLGDDELSRFTIDELEREGVDCSPVIRRPEARPLSAVVIVERPTARRSILVWEADFVVPRPDEVAAEMIAAARVLFLDHMTVEPGLHLAEIARDLHVPIVADFERVTTPRLLELVPQIDHLIVGLGMGRELTGEDQPERMVRALAGRRHACCAVTAGERGCWYAERDGPVRHVPAFPVPALDTTGCGDVFHGAYALALARGEPVDKAIMAATAAAALKAASPGGRAGIPDRQTVDRFLTERGFAL